MAGRDAPSLPSLFNNVVHFFDHVFIDTSCGPNFNKTVGAGKCMADAVAAPHMHKEVAVDVRGNTPTGLDTENCPCLFPTLGCSASCEEAPGRVTQAGALTSPLSAPSA